MYLLIFLVIAGLVGYIFARSRYSKPVDDAANKVSDTSKQYAGQASTWYDKRFGKAKQADPLRAWAAGPGATYLPEDFRTWLAGLSDKESVEFSKGLNEYSKGLSYDLRKLTDGSLDNQPALMQVYVEAVVSYSQAYRKAKQAKQEVEKHFLISA